MGRNVKPFKQRVAFMEMSNRLPNPKVLFMWHLKRYCLIMAFSFFEILCESAGACLAEDKKLRWTVPCLRTINLSSMCRRERRHFVAGYTSMLFTKWIISWKSGSLFTEILIPSGIQNKQVSRPPEKVYDKNILIMRNSIHFLREGESWRKVVRV